MNSKEKIEQMSMMQIVLYHLLPGIPILLLTILFSNPDWGLGLPIVPALMFAIMMGLIPVQLLIIKLTAKRQGVRLKEIISFSEKIPPAKFILLAVICFLAAGLIFTYFAGIEYTLWENFSLMPDWLRTDKYIMENSAMGMLWLTVIMNFIFNGFLGPIVEEFYFRGFLLPRMNSLGKAAPLINAALFSLYHFFSPWEIVTRILAFLPIGYTVWYKKNVYLGMVIHCSLNLVGCAGMLAAVIQM